MNSRSRWPLVRAYRAVSSLLPRRFGRALGEPLVDLFADLYEEAWALAGWRGALRVATREFLGLLRMVGSERTTGVRLAARATLDDLRAGGRTILRNPGLSTTVVLILALGIGGNTAIFSVLHTVVLRPLPYPDPEELMQVLEFQPDRPQPRVGHSLELYEEIRGRIAGVELGAFVARVHTMTGLAEPQRVGGWAVSASTLSLLRVAPLLGRSLEPGDERPGADDAVLLGHGLWRQRFGADRDVVGKTIRLDGREHRVVGVMPADFRFMGEQADFWVPLVLSAPTRQGGRPLRSVPLLVRLARGVEPERVEAEINGVLEGLRRDGPPVIRMIHTGQVGLVSLKDRLVGDLRGDLWMLQGAVALVLLIGCSNVANLLLARASTRRREVAMRGALGCGRGRLIRQLLCESLSLALLAGAVGSVLAVWATGALVRLGPPGVPQLDEAGISLPIWGFAFALALATGVTFGLAPALRSSRFDLRSEIASAGGAGEGRRQRRLRTALVVSQVALALMLAVGAGLLANSLLRLLRVDPGYEPEHVATLQIDLPPARYGEASLHAGFYDRLLLGVDRLPGVQAAGVANLLPLSPASMIGGFLIEGDPDPAGEGDVPMASLRLISPGYFNALGIPVVRGRGLGGDAAREHLPVVVVNESLAQRYFEGGDAVGRHVKLGRDAERFEIVGVVGDVRQEALAGSPVPTLYASHRRVPEFFESKGFLAGIFLAVRTAGEPMALIPDIRRVVQSIDADLPVFDVISMERRVWDSVGRQRFYATLLGLFSMAALVLVSVGIYGVVACFVSQRVPEIGVRVALGAGPGDILRLVVGEGLMMTLGGIAIGVAGALASTRLLSTLLFEVTPTDPATYAAVAGLLLLVSVAAFFQPTRRALGVDPMSTLRRE